MQDLATAISTHRCVAFAGAGATCDAGLPDWAGLATALHAKLKAAGAMEPPVETAVSQLLTSPQTLTLGLDMMITHARRHIATQYLRTILHSQTDSAVCQALRSLNLKGIITTNYDRIINSAVPPDSYILTNSLDDLKLIPTAVERGPFLFKIHGDIDNVLPPTDPIVTRGAGFMVLTASDYSALVQGERGNMLSLALHSILQTSSVLFIGYSNHDPDLSRLLTSLTESCVFAYPSWYIHRTGDTLPPLPNNVTPIPYGASWTDLPRWLATLSAQQPVAVGTTPPPTARISSTTDDTTEATMFRAVARYVDGLRTDSLAERVLSCAIVDDLATSNEITLSYLKNTITQLLHVGPYWAKPFALATMTNLEALGLIKDVGEEHYSVVKSAVRGLQRRATAALTLDRNSFYQSLRTRLGEHRTELTDDFTERLDKVLVTVCINLGERLAVWIHRGVGRDLDWSHVERIAEAQFTDGGELRRVRYIFEEMLDELLDGEIPYLYRLLSAAFLSNIVILDPDATKFLKNVLSSYELYLDSNVMLPLLIHGHPDHIWITTMIMRSRAAGVSVYALRPMVEEVMSHREVARSMVRRTRDNLSDLRDYVDTLGRRSNCFIHGFVRTVSANRTVTWQGYIDDYGDSDIRSKLGTLGVHIVPQGNIDEVDLPYGVVLREIEEEWAKRAGNAGRRPELNENEAGQFCHIYARRSVRQDLGRRPEAWFLSYETIMERVFDRHAPALGMAPTFPVSAWAAFLDSHIVAGNGDRRAVVEAIMRGNDATFALPDAVSLVRRRAFGHRIPSTAEDDAMRLVMTDEGLVRGLESARMAVMLRGRGDGGDNRSIGPVTNAAAQINEQLALEIERLTKKLEQERTKREADEESRRTETGSSQRKTPVVPRRKRGVAIKKLKH